MDSFLKIERAGKLPVSFPKRSNRGISQRIRPRVEGGLIATVDGGHRDGTLHLSRKYETEISCSDFFAPGFAGLWPGDEVTIHCAEPITQTLDAESEEAELCRDMADDTIAYGIKADGGVIRAENYNGRLVGFVAPIVAVRFCLRSVFLVQDWDTSGDNWDVATSWGASAIEKRGY